MSYEVIYWNMPICQTRGCEVPGSNPNKRQSLSCLSADFNIAEDAVWPGHAITNEITDESESYLVLKTLKLLKKHVNQQWKHWDTPSSKKNLNIHTNTFFLKNGKTFGLAYLL